MSDVVGSGVFEVTPQLAPGSEQRLANEIRKALANLEQQQRAQQASSARSAQAATRVTAAQNAQAQSTRSLTGSVNGLRAAYSALGVLLGGRFLQSVIRSRAEFERSQVAFSGLLAQSKEVKSGFETIGQATEGLTEDIRTLSILSGADFDDLARSAQSLVAGLGLSREVSVALLNDVASAAAASGASLDSIPRAVRAITQISAKGFLSAEELNQIADVLPVVARPKIYEELAKSLKLPIEEIQKLANEGGRITSAQGLPALIKVIQNVAGASDALDRQLKTLPGALNVIRGSAKVAVQEGFDRLSASINGLVENLGGVTGVRETFSRLLEPLDRISSAAITAFGDALISLLPTIEEAGKGFGDFISAAVGLIPALAPALGVFTQLATVALRVVNALGPFRAVLFGVVGGLVAVRVAASAATAISALGASAGTSVSALRNLGQGLSSTGGTLTGFAATASRLGSVVGGVLGVAGIVAVGASVLASFRKPAKSATEALAEFNDEAARTNNIKAFEALANIKAEDVAKDFRLLQKDAAAVGEEFSKLSLLSGKVGLPTPARLPEDFGRNIDKTISAFTKIVDNNQFATARAIAADERFAVIQDRLNKIIAEGEKRFKAKAAAGAADQAVVDALGGSTQSATAATDAFNDALKESTSQIESVLGAEGRRLDAAKNVKAALDKVRDAERNLADLRNDRSVLVTDQLAAVEERRVELLEDAEEAADRLTDAEEGVVSARRSVENATEGVVDAEERLVDARTALDALFTPATERELADARREIAKSEEGVTKAITRRVKAEEALAAFERRKANQGQRLSVIGLDALRTSLANGRASAAALRQLPDEEELRNELQEATLAEAEAKADLVESTEELQELEREGIPTAEALARARRDVDKAEQGVKLAREEVVTATKNVAKAENEVVKATNDLRIARDVELALQPLYKQQREELRDLDDDIAKANQGVAAATRDVGAARGEQAIVNQELTAALRVLNGEGNAEIKNLDERVRLYERLGLVGPAALVAIKRELDGLPEVGAGGLFGEAVQFLADTVGALPAAPKGFLSRFKDLAKRFEQGGIITKPTYALMGERNLKEVVLPLTKPARAMQLAQQSGFLDMLSKYQQPFFPEPISRPALSVQRGAGSGGIAVSDSDVAAQLKLLIAKLDAKELGETTNISVTGSSEQFNEKLRARQLARQVEKAVRRGRR